MKRIEYTNGEKLGVCIYISEAEKRGKHRYGLFKCNECSSKFEAKIDHIKALKIKNCGCILKRETHGESNTRLYEIWEAIKQRCYNTKNPNYRNYGKLGITMEKDWHTYSKFREWALSNGYSDELTIDRIDVKGNYTINNCRWEDMYTQAANKRFSKPPATGATGIEFSKQQKYTARLRNKGTRVSLGTYKTLKEAIYTRDKYIRDNNIANKKNWSDEEFSNYERHIKDSNETIDD